MDEFEFIDRIARQTETGKGVVKGIGDDAAVLKFTADKYLLFTTDMLVEGVHFTRRDAKAFDIGWKAVCVNISDIAAMGGVPKYALVSVGLPRGISQRYLDNIYRGIKEASRKFKIDIVGGDTNRAEKIIVSVSMLGEAAKKRIVYRAGAKPKDFIFVTGSIGGSQKSKKHLSFTPRLKEAQFLLDNFKPSAMLDISDGFSQDLWQIARASRVGALVFEEVIPLSKSAASFESALSEGEDFELLFTLSPAKAKGLVRFLLKNKKCDITLVGQICRKSAGIKLVDKNRKVKNLPIKGFRHF